MKTKSISWTVLLFISLVWLASREIASARTINITQAPYNASPSNAPVLNGLTDNGTIIQQVINQLISEGGGTCYIPAGNWQYATPIIILANPSKRTGSIIIRGDGAHQHGWQGGTDLIFKTRDGASDAFTFDPSSGYIAHGWGAPRVMIRDLAIDGGTQSEVASYKTLGNRYGIVVKYGTEFNINNVTVTGFTTAGILNCTSYWGAIRNADIAYCGIGFDDNGGNACVLRNISVHNCTTGMHNPESTIGGAIEGNYGNGILHDHGTTLPYDGSAYVAGGGEVHDVYFANNNAADTTEGADIDVNVSDGTPIWLTISGNCTFLGATAGESSRVNPYRRVAGQVFLLTRLGATRFTPLTSHALLDIPLSTGQTFIDASTQKNPADVSWTAGGGTTTYLWDYLNQTTFTILP